MEDKFSDIKLNTVAKRKNIVTQKLIEVRNSFFVSSYSRQLSLNVKNVLRFFDKTLDFIRTTLFIIKFRS